MSLKIEIEVPINTILAVQEAAKQDTSPASLQLARNLSFQAMRTAVEQLPYDINRKGANAKATAPVPDLKRRIQIPKDAPRQTKKVKSESEDIEVFIQKTNGKMLTCTVGKDDSILHLKSEIQDLEGIPPDRQHLLYQGRQMDDKKTLVEVGLDLGIVTTITNTVYRRVSRTGVLSTWYSDSRALRVTASSFSSRARVV